jgi:pyruvate/2-oxoacid:ferredoxin oxidoreductase alpha subunit/NAD-dependent dihydropyrimidine dehydrogenase PreA subunit
MPSSPGTERPKPFVFAEYCKGCGRCVGACAKDCIHAGTEINALTGLVPIELHLENCNGCGLCIAACPEPFGLQPAPGADFDLQDPEKMFGARPSTAQKPTDIPAVRIPLPPMEPMVVKGTYASALGALIAGCRHVYGYPITPSTEGAELMAKLLPKLDGVFLQAVSEVATVNIMYGASGAGVPCMTFTSSPGFSLMLEGLSYMIGAELPGVFVNIMRGGPGLGNIGPEQADVKLACRGLGHGNTHALVLCPATPQEMLDLTILAFDLSFKYRNPVVLLGDGYLGQITGKVSLPDHMLQPGLPAWAVFGDAAHRGNVINSIVLGERDLEVHNERLNAKYARMAAEEQRAAQYECADADTLLIACNTPAQMAKGAVRALRHQGVKAGLFRPITLWPFPIDALKALLPQLKRIMVVEASPGQIEDELRLALSYAGVACPPIEHIRHMGGVLPQTNEIVDRVLAGRAQEAQR